MAGGSHQPNDGVAQCRHHLGDIPTPALADRSSVKRHSPDPMGVVVSRPGEFHPRPLAERCGSLSAHTAPSSKRATSPLPVSEQTVVASRSLDEEARPCLVPLEPSVLSHRPRNQRLVEVPQHRVHRRGIDTARSTPSIPAGWDCGVEQYLAGSGRFGCGVPPPRLLPHRLSAVR